MISMDGSKSGKPEALKMIIEAAKAQGNLKHFKKAPMIRKKETQKCAQTTVTDTQTQIHVESESKVEMEECLNAVIISAKYAVSNLKKMIVIHMKEMSDSGGSDSHDRDE